MSRYGVYPGNTSASTSTTGETITDNDQDSEEFQEEEEEQEEHHVPETRFPEGNKQQDQYAAACSDESTAKQSTATASTPVYELPFPSGPLDPLSLASALSFQSGEALTPLERFAFNALIEHYCAQQVSLYLSPNLPHHIHEAYKKELYRRVTSSFGMTGGFDRDEFKGIRESILEGISAVVNSEMINIMQRVPISPSVEYTPARQSEFDDLGVENPEGNEVVRRVNRPKSSDHLAPINFVQANRRIATGLERPATSDGRKIGGIPGTSRIREGTYLRDRRRPELVRAMSFDHLKRGGGGPKTPPLAPPGLTRGVTSYTPGNRTAGCQTPQPRTPSMQSHPFRLSSFGPAPPPPTRERNPPAIPSFHHRVPPSRIPPPISPHTSALRASVSLQQQTAQAVPMERSWSVDRALSVFHPQPQHLSPRPNDSLQRFIVSKTSRYKTDFTELAFLGKGGFASVYKVRNILDGREYAIKKVPIRARHLNGKGEKLDVIFKEIKTLAKLEHRNVVRYYGAWVESANGLWERSGTNNWSTIISEARVKTASPRIAAQGMTEDMGLGFGTTPDSAKLKSVPVVTEIPVLGREAFIDENELKDPSEVNFSNTADDSMGIHFADDTSKDSEGSQSPAKVVVVMQESDCDSSDTDGVHGRDEEDEDASSDIEVIPRLDFPSLATQIPLPLSPQYPVEYVRQRRKSFVSDVDEQGNELPHAEPMPKRSGYYSTVSGSDSGLGEGTSLQARDRMQEIRAALKRHQETEKRGNGGVLDDEDSENTGDEDESGNTTSVSIRSSSKKLCGGQEGNSGIATATIHNRQIALVQADRLARKEADKKEILTLMIMMSVHPLTLKEFLWHEDSESTNHAVKHEFPLPRGLAIQLEQHNHDLAKEKEKYCWHLRCALKLFKGVLEGADYLHNKGIVHRDLKPGNIFLNIEGHEGCLLAAKVTGVDCRYCDKRCVLLPRIGDFGLVAELVNGVRRKGGRGGAGEGVDDDVLRGDVVGTALYRPPPSDEDEGDVESSSDDPGCFQYPYATPGVRCPSRRKKNVICEKTDVYALGIIFFELLYRCGTGSERVQCLVDLRDRRKLPEDWRQRVCMEGGVDEGVVDALGRCVMGMTERKRGSRWGLGRVKEELRVLEGWE